MSESDRETNVVKEGMRDLKNKVEEEQKKKIRKWVITFVIQHLVTIAMVFGGAIIGLLIIFAIGDVLGLLGGNGNSAYAEDEFSSVGGISPFGCEISKEEFIQSVENYNGKEAYNTYMKPYAEDFYDVCSEYNINPCLAFAHACLETEYGANEGCQKEKNYFGMAHYNTANSGASYSSVADSVKAYCEWVKNNSTEGTDAYNKTYAQGKEYAQENSKLSGTPTNNIYVLYCRYAFLGAKHLCDEPDFNNPKGTDYYINNGSNWGKGGRIYIYEMYENGGLYTGRYKELCGHESADDATTTRERADYQEYTTNKRIKIAKNIFGNSCFGTTTIHNSGNSLLQAADKVTQYVIDNGLTYKATDEVDYTFPIQKNGKKTLSCSSFVQQCLWEIGYTKCEGNEKLYARRDKQSAINDLKRVGIESVDLIENLDDLAPGDIMHFVPPNKPKYYHVVIVYSINGTKVTVKGMPEAAKEGMTGITHTLQSLKNQNCFAIRIKN